jgi:hypothetical protein
MCTIDLPTGSTRTPLLGLPGAIVSNAATTTATVMTGAMTTAMTGVTTTATAAMETETASP